MKKTVVLYHANCTDGFSAAWAAWKKFGDSSDYIPVQHQKEPPEGLEGKEIYMVDFSYRRPVLEEMVKKNEKVVVLDHHVSAKEDIKVATEHVFQNNHSGAVITWNYFHEEETPLFLKYVEDFDLFRYSLENADEISTFIWVQEFDFENWSRLARDFEDKKKFEGFVKEGRSYLTYKEHLLSELVEKAYLVEFEGRKTLAVNSSLLVSEVGHALYEKMPPMAIVWHENSDGIKVSLRSDGTADVSELAGRYGGGGHKGAAAFKLSPGSDLPWKIIKS